MNSTPKKQTRGSQGRFAKGTSGNPSGRPVGSRNQSTLLLEELLDGEGEALTRKAIELALQGDSIALRLCMERLLPVRKDRKISLSLPDVSQIQDARTAIASILAAVGQGQITPNEAEKLTAIVEAQGRMVVEQDFERRITELENAIQPISTPCPKCGAEPSRPC